jgi:hypothetical protein
MTGQTVVKYGCGISLLTCVLLNAARRGDSERGDIKQLPETEDPLVLRTDFSNRSVWEKICASIREPVGDFQAYMEYIDDPAYQDISKEQLLQLVPADYAHSFIILADRTAISSAEFPLLIVDWYDEPGREFRAIPSQVQGIENNLSIANMDFHKFADSVDQDGVFRGFLK